MTTSVALRATVDTASESQIAGSLEQHPLANTPPIPLAGVRRAARGSILVAAGFPATSLYVIRRGQVRVFLLSDQGHETTTAVLGSGHLVGIAALLGRETYHAFAEALTPVEAWVVPIDRLRAEMQTDAELLARIASALARRLAFTEGLIGDVTLLPVRDRLHDVVGRLDLCLGGEEPHLTRENMAKLIGARRETVSRATTPRTRRPTSG